MSINEIKERLSKITPGPWSYDTTFYAPEVKSQTRLIAKVLYHMGNEDSEVIPNAEFIANATEDIKFLLAENEKLRIIFSAIEPAINELKHAVSCGGINELRSAGSNLWKAWDENSSGENISELPI